MSQRPRIFFFQETLILALAVVMEQLTPYPHRYYLFSKKNFRVLWTYFKIFSWFRVFISWTSFNIELRLARCLFRFNTIIFWSILWVTWKRNLKILMAMYVSIVWASCARSVVGWVFTRTQFSKRKFVCTLCDF